MAPSVAELQSEAPIIVPIKSISEQKITVESVPIEDDSSVKAHAPVENSAIRQDPTAAAVEASKPKVRRVIDEEGGTTTASVSSRFLLNEQH
jgi:hypothetical protein